MTQKKKVMIVDDHPFFIHGLERYLSAKGKYEIQSALSVSEAMALVPTFKPDLMVMDVSMAEGGGMALLRQVKDVLNVPTMFLTVQIDPEDTIEAMKLGIDGIALKDRDPEDIVKTIDALLAGEASIDPAVTERALRHSVQNPTPKLRQDDLLTSREIEIVEFVCRGQRNKEIADHFNLTEGTVKVHLHNVYRKLGVSSRAELIVKQGGLNIARA
ncbi:MAG: response regulator transcription factor [Alphaproteobacteria bacterium]|jgi:Response regulator containing a CheY-like receiver domain and an HTH DNA-binding domain|nr:response regulator transcription factor [Alphaproteobacteria bacterium]MBU0792392.1 response regulator transcription factor [Alphaproteobacteria bacterium]MBU0877157.1 response regulator transcription factor [Alphaproteobacteria bacterium]MBU1770731.1 response regulator transcription factor [Alphaproteobacteria bacterium]